MPYRGIDGFLPGSRASIMLDIVFLAMFLAVPLIGFSILAVRQRRRFLLHKRLQVAISVVLLVAVALFELDMQFVSGWLDRAEPSPYFDVTATDAGSLRGSGPGMTTLYVHLAFAISTLVVWSLVLYRALRNFPSDPTPSLHSGWHKRWGWAAAIGMLLTSVTGWIFYWQAFMA